jgi:hypothetical protein
MTLMVIWNLFMRLAGGLSPFEGLTHVKSIFKIRKRNVVVAS